MKGYETHVCKLHKSLYRLKQASGHYFIKLSSGLKDAGFHHSHYDYSLFVWHQQGSFFPLLVYLDDVVLVGNHFQHIETLNVSYPINSNFRTWKA